jgi:hypothetical protein
MAYSVFSFRSIRLVALFTLVGIGLLGGVSKAGVINIDLTGYTGDNGGVPEGQLREIQFGPDGTKLLIANRYGPANSPFTGLGVGHGPYSGIASSSFIPVRFQGGETIDGAYLYNGFSSSAFSGLNGAVGDFGPNSFLGFRTSTYQYGYIEVTWTGSTNTFQLISAAYESTPGVAIQTPGGQAPVPEPASAMIASLFLGGAALKRWRSKRS